MASATYKVVLMGEGGSGKTAWIRRLMGNALERKYIPTLGVEVHPIPLDTAEGPVVCNIWDTAGQERYGGLRDGYYIGGHLGIVFIDAIRPDTYKAADKWSRDFRRICPDAPLVMVINKTDLNPAYTPYPQSLSISVANQSPEELEAPLWAALAALHPWIVRV